MRFCQHLWREPALPMLFHYWTLRMLVEAFAETEPSEVYNTFCRTSVDGYMQQARLMLLHRLFIVYHCVSLCK